MRLSIHERQAITEAVHSIFGADSEVRLFGSRVDDQRRGGDIDLFIEVAPESYDFERELDLQVELLKRLGEQRIDLIVHPRGREPTPIERIAMKTGIPL